MTTVIQPLRVRFPVWAAATDMNTLLPSQASLDILRAKETEVKAMPVTEDTQRALNSLAVTIKWMLADLNG